MKFKEFLRDRLIYTIIYFAGISLAFIVTYLAMRLNTADIPFSNVIYVYAVAVVFYVIFLLCEYYKTKSFYKELSAIIESDYPIEKAAGICKGRSIEQRLFVSVLKKMHRSYENELYKFEDMEKQYTVFTSQWVHQMKTPVSVINLLLQEDCSEEDKELFHSIEEENEKISQGLNIMLYNARINDFNHDFNVEDIDIITILRKVINDNKKMLIRKRIFPQIIGSSTFVQTDKKWMYFVISQIVINAVKYTEIADRDKKFIKFIISEKDDKISVCIKDNGIGIPREDIGRVFNEFFTGKNGRKSSESTGMGLYLSKTICNEMGHGLDVKSEEGQGAEFYITFCKEKNIFKINE